MRCGKPLPDCHACAPGFRPRHATPHHAKPWALRAKPFRLWRSWRRRVKRAKPDGVPMRRQRQCYSVINELLKISWQFSGRDAVSYANFHLRVHAGVSGRIFHAWTNRRFRLGFTMARGREPVLLWLVGSALRPFADRIHSDQHADLARNSFIVPRRFTTNGEILARRRHRDQSDRVGHIQVYRLSAAHRRAVAHR